MPITDPVAAGQQRDADLAQIMADLATVNPHDVDMALAESLTDDGGT